MRNPSVYDICSRKLFWPYSIILLFVLLSGCSVAEPSTSANTNIVPPVNTAGTVNNETAVRGATIAIDPNGPADTVRVFYKNLREKKFREAIFLTNLRPAIEGLTETELNDFALDFEAIAGQVPAEIEINGEIITGDRATVTAVLPNDVSKQELQKINLKKAGDIWVILTVDEEAEARIKKEGKQYFYNLRIETHQDEAKKMLERISKAQLAHSLQNGGVFTDMQTLVSTGLLPPDVKTSVSTGYNYVINLATDKKQYYATATPATYAKSGKLSFILKLDAKGISRVTSQENGGKPMIN